MCCCAGCSWVMRWRGASRWIGSASLALLCWAAASVVGQPVGPSGDTAATTLVPVRSAAEIDYPPFSFLDGENPTGFSVELLEAAGRAMGREIRFQTGSWSEVRGRLERGEVEVLPLVGRTPEREAVFDFTFPYLSLLGTLVVRQGDGRISGISDLAGRTVAVMRGDNAEEFLRRRDFGHSLVVTDSFETALRDLSAGRHDAVLVQRLVGLRLIRENGLDNLRVLSDPIPDFRQEFCFAVREGDRETLVWLNEGLAVVIADGTFRRLEAKWFGPAEVPGDRLVFGGDHAYPPYEFLDASGEPSGFNVDLTREIARVLDLDIEIRLGPWTRILESLGSGEIDAAMGMFYSPARDRTYGFSPPFTVNHGVAVTRLGESASPESAEDLRGKRLVLQSGDVMDEYVREHGLIGHLTLVETQEDALRELAQGLHDCALVSRLTALHLIREHGWDNLVVGPRPLASPEYGYAALDQRTVLLAQLTEGLKLVENSGEFRRIQKKWLGVDSGSPDLARVLRLVALGAVPAGLLLLGLTAWSWTLRKEVARQTRELRRSEAQFRSLVEGAPDAIFVQTDRRFAYVNARTCELLGASRPEELLGRPIIEQFHPSVREQVAQRIRNLNERGQAVPPVVETFLKLDGEPVPVEVSAVPMNFGGKDGALVFVRDVTERIEAERAIHVSEERRRLALEGAELATWDWDVPTGAVLSDRRWAMMLGYRSEELPVEIDSWERLIHPEDFPAVRRAVENHFEGRADTFESEHRVRHRSGQWFWVLARGRVIERDSEGRPLRACGTYLDLTARKQAEESARSFRELQQAIVEASPFPILSIDPDGRVLSWNPAAERVFGWTAAEVIGQSLPIVGPDAEVEFRRLRERILAGESISGMPISRRRKDGTLLALNLSAAPIRDASGGVTAIAGAFEDVTERKRLESQLLQAQKMESVGRLAGGVAHDFNNMLGVILGNAELALEKVGEAAGLRDELEEIVNAARRSGDITRQLLAFARRQTISPRVIDLNDLVGGTLKLLRRLLGEAIELQWQPGGGLWPIRMDPAQVDQILANLCVNARDAIQGNGRITIETHNLSLGEDDCAGIPDSSPGDWVRLTVSDNGSGMDQVTVRQIFEPFYTTKAMGKGTGLGLPMVYGVVHQNGGFISVASEPGEGTTFEIYLPRFRGSIREEVPPAPEALPRGHGEGVLIVEDEPSIMRLGARILEGSGYQVYTAATPSEAVKLFQGNPNRIRLLVTDVIMPETNGRVLAERLREEAPKLKVLFMSGYTSDVIAQQAVLEEGVHFIQKPFSTRSLATAVRRALDG